jgi:sugar lactone lactonase YvrE
VNVFSFLFILTICAPVLFSQEIRLHRGNRQESLGTIPDVRQLAVPFAGERVLALDGRGQVHEWRRSSGQWYALDAPGGVRQIAAGVRHTLLLLDDGAVWSAEGAGFRQIVGLPEIAGIAAGAEFSLALDRSGQVWAWGANWTGIIPGESRKIIATPMRVSGIPLVKGVVVRGDAPLAWDGTNVWSWGLIDYPQRSMRRTGEAQLVAGGWEAIQKDESVELRQAVSLSASSAVVAPAEGSGSFSITTDQAWTATSSDSWLAVTPASGPGSATLTYNYTANTGTAGRMAAITVAGRTFTVTQAAANGSFTAWGTGMYGVIRTIAGSGAQSYSGDGGAATAAALNGPNGVNVDSRGNVYIADSINHRIRKVSAATGIITTIAGTGTPGYSGDGGPATSAQLYFPFGVALDGSGNVYISDFGNSRIRKVSAVTGLIATIAGTGAPGYSGDGGAATAAQLYTYGIAVDDIGNVYAADAGNQRVRMISSTTGVITTIAGTGVPGYSGDGGAATAAQLNDPVMVAVDGSGNVYVADKTNNRIRMISAATGLITTIAGTGTAGFGGDGGAATAAQLFQPVGIGVDASGNVYFTDTQNSRVRKIGVATGVITTIAGTGVYGYAGEGGSANGLAVDRSGNVYVCDLVNNRIRFIDFTTPLIGFSEAGANIGSAAGTGKVDFTTLPAGGYWVASSSAAWLALGAISGTGASTLNYSYGGNPNIGNRGATITINGASYAVTQVGSTVTLSARSTMVAPSASTGTFSVTVTPPLSWTAFSSSSWLTATPPSGTGSATVTYSYSANAGTTGRTATITIGDQTFTVVQAAANGSFTPWGVAAYGAIRSIAGTGTSGYSGDGGPATAAKVTLYDTITVDGSGNVYFADGQYARVRKVTAATGIITTIAGTGTSGFSGDGAAATAAQLNGPRGVAVDSSGNLYIGEWSRIRQILAATGIITTVAGTGSIIAGGDGGAATAAQLTLPTGMAVDGSGNVFFSDYGNHRIRKISAATGVITTIAGTGMAGFLGDGGLATAAQLNTPRGLAVDSGGNVYVADSFNHRIRKISSATGAITTVAGTGTQGYVGNGGVAAAAQLNNPVDVAVDSGENLFIADSYNYRIRKVIAATGIITTIAGTGNNSFAGDGGAATAAQLLPNCLAVDSSGNIVVGDPGNARILFIDYTTPQIGLGAASASVGASAGAGSVSITTTQAGSLWVASSNASWLTLGASSGTGAGTLNFSYSANPSISGIGRTAVITVNGVPYTVTQGGVFFFPAISGQVTLAGSGLSGVTLTGTGFVPVITNAGGSYTFPSLIFGITFTVTPSLAGYTFSPPSATFNNLIANQTANFTASPVIPGFDINGDGKSDILWQNPASGDLWVWFMNGTAVTGAAAIGSPTTWRVPGVADFNGDGKPDILWQEPTSGDLWVWFMNGTAQIGAAPLGGSTTWRVVGTGDFNGDGKPDILWQEPTSGDLWVWFMNGAVQTGAAPLGGATTWKVVGAADLNGDGKPDILWQNPATGDLWVWYMNGAVTTGAAPLSGATTWKVVGSGDFNADGKPDILWQQPVTGDLWAWFMNGTIQTGAAPLGGATAWKAIGAR